MIQRSRKWYKAIRSSLRKRWHHTPSWRRKMEAVLRKNASRAAKIGWTDPEFRKRKSKQLGQTSRRLWKEPSHRKRMVEVRKRDWSRAWRHRERSKLSTKIMKQMWRDPKFRAFKIRKVREQWKSPEFAKRVLGSISYPSRPQIGLFRRLCRASVRGLKLEYQVGRYWIDIAHLPSRTAVEVDGIYWHTERDHENRDKFLKSQGWKIVRIPVRRSRVLDRDFKRVLAWLTK